MREEIGCKEYRDISRRKFIVGSGKLAIALGAAGALLPRVSLAQTADSDRDTIVSVYLRGGCDGLSLCVPHGEDNYYNFRPTIAVPRPDDSAANRALDLDGFFGLSPAMAPLMDAYSAGDLLFVHATGLANSSRSHFENQRWMETGAIVSVASENGWLGRHLATSSPTRLGNTVRGVAIGNAVPQTLAGGPGTTAISDIARFGIDGLPGQQNAREDFIREAYRRSPNLLLRESALAILETIDLLGMIDFENYSPMGGASYPASHVGTAFKSAAALIRADLGVEAMTLDIDGWDTHDRAGTNGGFLFYLMEDLSASLAAFHQDLSASNRLDRTTMVMMSEFGRTVRENASWGTDHGTGGAMMVLGGGIQGGRVIADWPGLSYGALYEGQDLAITIDYRDVLAEIVDRRLKNGAALEEIFPGYMPTYRGVTKA